MWQHWREIPSCVFNFNVYWNPQLPTSTVMLIVALAFTDLLAAATVMPLAVDAAIHSKRRFSDTICKAHAFAMAVLAQVYLPHGFNGFQSVTVCQEEKPLQVDTHEEVHSAPRRRHLGRSADY